MVEKKRIVILNKIVSNGIVMGFRNACNKIGSYDKDKVERFKKKILEKSLEFGEKVIIVFDEIDDAMLSVTDRIFDKIEDMKKSDKDLVNDKLTSDDMRENESYEDTDKIVLNKITPTKSINFEDLEPLGNILDVNDDIVFLQGLKMELLSDVYGDMDSKEDSGVRKK